MRTAYSSIKNKELRIKLFIAFGLLLTALSCAKQSFALSVASTYAITDTSVKSGDIVADQVGKGIARANVAYDNRIFGVVEDDPLAVYRNTTAAANERPVIRSGDATVNVTDYNGKISIGDYVTSSPVSGSGMKATLSGNVIGVATSAVTETGKVNAQGKQLTAGTVTVAINIAYVDISTARSNIALFSQINSALFKNVQDPEKFATVVRYIIAGVIALLSFGFGFLTFSRSISKGIEAIGRNPLAKRAIQASIVLEIVMTVITSLAGVVLAFIIVRF